MSRWNSLLGHLQFPLKLLFFATLLLGIGSIMTSPFLVSLWNIENESVFLIAELLKFCGGFLIQMIPFFMFTKIITRKFEANVPVIVGISGYFVFLIVVMFFAKQGYPSYYYEDTMGIGITIQLKELVEVFAPFRMGIIPLCIVYLIVRYVYQKSRRHLVEGIFGFLDHDAWSMVITLVLCGISGAVVALGWPYLVDLMELIFTSIGNDSGNPMNLAYYGIIERIYALLGLADIPRNIFWFGELGGSYLDASGMKYLGDVGVWTYQMVEKLPLSTGKFITPYYVMNLFLMPSFIFAYYSLVSSKKDRMRYLPFIILACVLSIICGNTLPMEFLMMILAPLLFIIYLVLIGMLYAIFMVMGVQIGYQFDHTLLYANPGSGLELLQYLQLPNLYSSVMILLGVGLLFGIAFYFITRLYFNKLAVGLFQFGNEKVYCEMVVRGLGGIENIIHADHTPDKMTVSLVDPTIVDFDELKQAGAYVILESKDGYLLRLGNCSTIIAREINRQKETENCIV